LSQLQGEVMVGIIGMRTTTKNGTLAGKYIPSMYVLLEDDLAQHVVNCMYSGANVPMKYILSGVWRNQPSCLYGFLTYSMEIQALKLPYFGIVAITDGDISEADIQGKITGAIQGDYKNPDQEVIAAKIAESTTAFMLEHDNKDIKGRPEYNHKKWLEEITPDIVESVNKTEPPGFIQEKRHLSTLFELIEFSKSITDKHDLIKTSKGKSDYHTYYEIIKNDFKPSNTDDKLNHIHWYILSCIKKYNPEKWSLYTNDVQKKIDSTYQEHRQRFMESSFDFR
jgi:hypothetical protein